MLRAISHGDVVQLELSSVASRLMRYGVSAYVTRGVLIDTGFPDVGREVSAWLDANPVEGCLVTHAHEDHAGNIERLARRGVPIGVAPDSITIARVPGPIGLYRRICWGVPEPLRAPITPFAHPALELRPARGHSSDHHVVWDAERETLFGGDLFIGVKVRIAHRGEDLRAQVGALRDVIALKPRRVFDGHRGILADPIADLCAKADWIEETIAAIEDRARRGWSERAIRDDVLGREDLTGIASAGDYSRLNFVQSVVGTMEPG
ncbi:MAG: MBL fold metallo-hydrolase [Gemmatimonadaceae bacterium]